MQVRVKEPRASTIRSLVAALSHLDGVCAIILSGSLARGYSDQYSDIDLGILCEAVPDREARLAAVAGIRDEAARPFLSTQAAEGFFDIGGQWVDLHYTCVTEWQEAVQECTHAPESVEPWTMETFQNVHYGAPLYDPRKIAQELTRHAQVYPPDLRRLNAVEYFTQSVHDLTSLAENESLPGDLAYLLSAPGFLFPVFRCLGALNECLYFGGWQMEFYLETFRVAPPRCVERLRSACAAAPDGEGRRERQAQMASLVRDLRQGLEKTNWACQRRDGPYSVADSDSAESCREPESVTVRDLTAEGLQLELSMLEARLNQPPAEMVKYARRGAVVWYRELLRERMLSLVKVLMRLNQVAEVKLRDLDEAVKAFRIKPKGIYEGLLSLPGSADLLEVHRGMTQMVDEVRTLKDSA